MLSQKYQAEQQEIDDKISQLRATLEKEHQNAEDAGKWINLVKQYEYPTELTAELLNALIEKILIHEPVKSSPGFKDQEIELLYPFAGKLDEDHISIASQELSGPRKHLISSLTPAGQRRTGLC